jgi:hypothetical protein
MLKLTVEFCGSNEKITTRINTDDEQEALEKGVKKLFGKKAFFFQDHGLNLAGKVGGYGQIFKQLDSFATSLTNRVYTNIK